QRVVGGLRRRCDQHTRHYIVLRPEVLVAGRVGDEHSDGYIFSAREAGDVFRGGIVESELPFLLEEQRCDGGELFADRADRVTHVGCRAGSRVELSSAVSIGICEGSVLDDRDSGAWNTCGLQDLRRNQVCLPYVTRYVWS